MNAFVNGYEVVTTEERLAREADRRSAEFARHPSTETWTAMRTATSAYASEVAR